MKNIWTKFERKILTKHLNENVDKTKKGGKMEKVE
jgi:hypothetical protein